MNPSFYPIALLLSCGLTLVRLVGAEGEVLNPEQIFERNAGWKLSIDQILEAFFKLLERTKELEKLVETLTTRVAFTVTNPTPIEAVGSDVTLKYETVITKLGANYDPTTGILTVVTPGLYYFTFFFHTGSRKFGEPGGLELQVNGNRKGGSIEQVAGGDYIDNSGYGVVLDLARDDEVKVVLREEMSIIDDPDHFLNTFTGFLLRPVLHTDVVCSSEWERFGDSCYYMTPSKDTWQGCREFCQSNGGGPAVADLVTIHSIEEQEFVDTLVGRQKTGWIGLTDIETEGVFKWVDGTTVQSGPTFWREGEPDDYAGAEDCVWFYYNEWRDWRCDDQTYYCICEISF